MPTYWYIAAPPGEDDLVLAGEADNAVRVWSLQGHAEVASIVTVHDFGGQRLALVTGEQPVIVAGAWARHGVCGYSLTGEQLWQNKKRSSVQYVTALGGGRVAVGYARGPALVLDVSSGQELLSLRGVTRVHGLTPELSLLESNGYVRLADADAEPTGKRIALTSFAVICAAASAEHVAVSEAAAGALRILDRDGVERAAYPVAGGAVTSVAHDPATGTWRAIITQEYDEVFTYELIRLSDDGELLEQRPLAPVYDAAWLQGARVLVYGNQDGVFALDGETETPLRLV